MRARPGDIVLITYKWSGDPLRPPGVGDGLQTSTGRGYVIRERTGKQPNFRLKCIVVGKPTGAVVLGPSGRWFDLVWNPRKRRVRRPA